MLLTAETMSVNEQADRAEDAAHVEELNAWPKITAVGCTSRTSVPMASRIRSSVGPT